MKSENRPKIKFDGKEYDMYQATQMQRKLERTIRYWKRREMGEMDTDKKTVITARLRRLHQKYKAFSKAAGLPEQRERMQVYQPEKNEETLANTAERSILNSGAISGALNPLGARAQHHAEQYYESVRKMTSDVAHIARNTGYTEQQIQDIKNYVFYETHVLDDDKIARFDASYEMAESWQRLIDGKAVQPHDLTLLMHESMERELVLQGYTQDEAHIMTSAIYNYAKEAYEYYDKIGAYRKKE